MWNVMHWASRLAHNELNRLLDNTGRSLANGDKHKQCTSRGLVGYDAVR
jgi:hypothetical protein